ncbi:hypothetical protein DPMN_154867 [Dreissena polymorpha]|uniref:Sacsin/Nov domain-containing protein n=1 Tax=Dreissena polymorpha TaxID=45954 RepID=A0A9D4FLY8_DREPO|nr:hypothetical protein DPMN_154867 [Dreissena polymorpha]
MRVHTHAIPFGQREDLTTRLNGILKDYPCDKSIMKELIQNADDAGAHEIHFIKYFESKNVGRTLEHDSVLKPALCVYNDTCFKKDDFVGIQELGIGGKGNKSFKIGRFGIGFNAVYHITDIPSFLTKGPGLKGRGQVCLFDPLLKHIRDLTGGEPGVRYNVDDLIEEFPDTVVGFPYMTNTCGTMFRLPLRQEESKISKNCLKPLDVELMLQHFIKTMPECLHFAKNIRTIKVMTYSKGKYKCEYEVKSEITQEDEQRRNSFFESVKEHATSLESNQINVEYTMRINVNKKKQSTIWLIANQFGSCFPLEQNDEMTAMTERGLLPIGGVSIKLCENPWQVIAALSKDGAKCRSWQPVNGCAYCFLPLPISTGLPFHVNGHFQLDRGRRNLWNQGYGKKWNEFILSIVVSGALKNALTFLQKYLLNDYLHMDELQEEILRRKYLQMYFCHFPRHQMDGVSEWAFFVTEFYRLMIRTRMRLFPFFSQNVNGLQSVGNVHNQRVVEWVHLSTDVENLDGGVVNTLFKWSYCHETEKQELRFVENILRKLFIKVSDTDKAVVADIEKSIKESIIRTTPHVLMQILKARFETVDLGVENCVFETAAGVHIILKFISQYDRFVDEIEGLPLCLTNDNVVRRFRTLQDVFCSQFCDLMPGSSSLFLHKDLVFLLNSDEMFSKNIFKRFTVRSLVSLLPSSFDPEIFCKDENVRWKSDEFELVEPQTIYRLFKFLYEESFVSKHTILPRFNKKLFLENVTALSNWSFLPSQRKSRCLDTFELIPINQSYTLLSDTHLCEEVTKKVLQKMELPSIRQCCFNRPFEFGRRFKFCS